MAFAHLPAVVEAIEPLAHRFRDAGHHLYLVGGIVRDQWLDHELGDSSDIDMTTDAQPAVIKELVADLATALWTQGERFGTIGLRFDGRAIEITTHRAESYDPDSRKPEVAFGDDILGDLSRRDFTINAMAYEVPEGRLVDPYGGVGDLEAAVLRTPLEPEVSFRDDPLRMLRAARFAARFGLDVDPALVAAASQLRTRLRIVAIERIGDEIERLFALPEPSTGVEFLVETGLCAELLGWGTESPVVPVIGGSELGSLVQRVDDPDWRARFAAFLLGASGDAEQLDQTVRRLRLSRDDQRRVLDIAGSAATFASLAEHTPDAPALRRWYARTAAPEAARAVARAASSAGSAAMLEATDRALDDLGRSENLGPPEVLDGRHIMESLDLPAGPLVGEAVEMLRQAVFDHGPLPRDDQMQLLQNWWSDRSAGA